MIARLSAIVRADFLLRFRRVSTAVVFLLLGAFAYVWLPPASSGRTLIQMNGHRAIYNSGAVGLGTASLGMMFVGLFGYYFISNTVRRDLHTRCGVIIASTPMRSLEYLTGKFLGNVVFLVTFLGGFMLVSLAMQVVRAEATLEPLVFLRQYLLLTPSIITLVSAVAVLFESIPRLAGKFGDVLYFFLYLGLFGLVVSNEATGGRVPWTRYLDFTGFGFMIHQLQHTLHTNEVSIGSSTFDPSLPVIIFPGLSMTRDWLAPRIAATFLPLALLPVAALFFHRFDPVKAGTGAGKTNRRWLGKLQNLIKPIARPFTALLSAPARGRSFFFAIWRDAALTFTILPVTLLAFVGISVATISAPRLSALPVIVAVVAVIISDVATRDVRAGTLPNLYAFPRLRENFVAWKFASAFFLSVILCLIPLLISSLTARVPSLLSGIFFLAATSTLLGVLTRNSKTFIVAFLSFWYLVVNDKGTSPLLDFAGFNRVATMQTAFLYTLLGSVALVCAHFTHRLRLAR